MKTNATKNAAANSPVLRASVTHQSHLFSLGRGMKLGGGVYVGTLPSGEHWVSYANDFAEMCEAFDKTIGS